MRIDRREDHRLSANHPKISAAKRLWHDVLGLPRPAIVTRELPAIDDIRVQRVGRDVTIFFGCYRMPFAESDLAVVAPAGDTGGPAFLLTAAETIWKSVVGVDMIKLCRRLVVPTTPGLTAVSSYDCALIAAQHDHVGITGTNANVWIVVAAGRAAKCRPGLAAVNRLPGHGARRVHDVRILWIESGDAKIAAADATGGPSIFGGDTPTIASVVRAVE